MKKRLLLLALMVSVLSVAEGSYAVETDYSATGALAEGNEWNAAIQGQFLNGTLTDLVKGEGPSVGQASGVVWDGFIAGTFGYPQKTDLALLPVRESGGKEAWNGYLTGSFSYR